METDCIFCLIVAGKAPSHKIWENEKHLAFLSIFPNTEGFSVVIPKAHYESYVFDVPEDVMQELMTAARAVSKRIDGAFTDVGRTGVVFEGYGVNHLHAKLFPMHGTKSGEWKKRASSVDKYFETYEGYISSHDYHRANDEKLAALAKKIRGEG
jgi:diadenosine tetraphosphate (Ap4A) HIT family hydrolase